MTRRDHLVDRISEEIVNADTEPWQLSAACAASPALVNHTRPPRVWSGLALCAGCPVIAQCDTWSRNEPDYVGVAGGAVWTSRRRSRRSTTYTLDTAVS